MNLLRLEDFEVDLRFKSSQLRFLKSETDFRILRIVS
jgi:hypothetical protein